MDRIIEGILCEGGLGKSSLHCVSSVGSVENVRFLLTHNVNVNALDEERRTPLHYACRQVKGGYEVARLLLNSGARTDLLDIHKRPPEHYARIMWGPKRAN